MLELMAYVNSIWRVVIIKSRRELTKVEQDDKKRKTVNQEVFRSILTEGM